MPIQTRRLVLREQIAEDVDWLYRIYSQPEVARYLPYEPWSREFAVQKNDEWMGMPGLDQPDGRIAVAALLDGEAIGNISFWVTDSSGPAWKGEIGWVFDPDFAGHGYATEAAAAVLDVGFDRYGMHKVRAQMDARNEASAAVARRLGMRQEALLRQDWWSKGEWTDTLIFGRLASDRG
jgi:RimJ/RimL family protein N-acetyltransferase